MKIKITESQFIRLTLNEKKAEISELISFESKPDDPNLLKALKCGYKSVDSYKKNKDQCPSKILKNAQKCGWNDILKYEASGWRCSKQKAFLKPNEHKVYNTIKEKLGLSTGFEKMDSTQKLFSNMRDRPDLHLNNTNIKDKNICKPFCVSDEISCFIWFVRKNQIKIKEKLGGSISKSEFLTLTKVAIGLLGWQSNYGTIDRLYDIDSIRFLGLEIRPYDVYTKPGGAWALKKYAELNNKSEPSLGPGEFQISQFEKTGVQKEFGFGIQTVIGSGLAAMIATWRNYLRAKSIGLSSGPSKNEIAKTSGAWPQGVQGTGNHLWDIAISLHTWPAEKMLTKYCKTYDPLFAAPCNKQYHSPFKDEYEWKKWVSKNPKIKSYYTTNKKGFPGKIKVKQSEPILDYYPFLSGAHGDVGSGGNDSKTILEYVAKKMTFYGCVDLQDQQFKGKRVNYDYVKPKTPPTGGVYYT